MQRASQELVTYARHWGKLRRSRLGRRPPTIVDIAPAAEDPRAQTITWFSPTLGLTKRLSIYLPPTYACESARYPVLVLLRGHEREWIHKHQDDARAGHNTIDVYEELLALGEVGPMILVMPSMTSDDGSVHSIGIDFVKPWLGVDARGVGTGRWETYLREDVLHLVDRNWRTLGTGAHRGIDGFSLGGAMSLKFAAKFPALFRTAGAYDGTFLYADGAHIRGDDHLLHNPIWEPALGTPRNLEHAAANNAPNLIDQADADALQRLTWMVAYGPEHVEPWGSNFYRGQHLIDMLARRGISNALGDPVIPDSTHSWANADNYLRRTLPIHWRHLRPTNDQRPTEHRPMTNDE